MEVEGFKGEVVSLVWKRVMCLQGQGGLMSGGVGLTDGCLYYISGQFARTVVSNGDRRTCCVLRILE